MDDGPSDPEVTDRANRREAVGIGEKVYATGVAIGLLLAGLVTSLLFGVVFTIPLVLIGGPLSGSVTFLAFAAVGQLAFLAVGWAYVRRAGGVTIRRPTRRDLVFAGGGLVTALALVLIISAAVTAVGVAPAGSVFDDPIAQDPTVALGLAALSIVLVAPAEELLFRGAIQGRLRRSFGPIGAITGASLIFGSIHFANFTGSLVGAMVGAGIVTVGGAVFGTIYERTGNLLVPIIAHAAYNTVLLVAAFFSL